MITTSGFRPTVLPGIEYPDARLYASNIGQVIPQAMQSAGNLMQIVQQAKEAPIRQQIMQLQIQGQQLAAKRAQLESAIMSRPVYTPMGSTIQDVTRPSNLAPEDTPADYQPPVDVVSMDKFSKFDPLTGISTEETRQGKPIMTAEQIKNQDSLIEARNQLDAYRDQLNELTRQRNEAHAQYEAVRAQAFLAAAQNPKNHYRQGIDPVTGRQIYQVLGPDGTILHSIDSGLLSAQPSWQTVILGLNQSSGNSATSIPGLAPQGATPALSPQATQAVPQVDASFSAFDDLYTKGGKKASVSVSVDLTKPITPEQAGKLPKGTRFQGQDGIWRTKN